MNNPNDNEYDSDAAVVYDVLKCLGKIVAVAAIAFMAGYLSVKIGGLV